MSSTPDDTGGGQGLLDALLDSWDRNQTILRNLLHAVPNGGLAARVLEGSPTVAQMFTHMHHERMVSVRENAPECAGPLPAREWNAEPDANRPDPARFPLLLGHLLAVGAVPGEVADVRAVDAAALEELAPVQDRVRLAIRDQPPREVEQLLLALVEVPVVPRHLIVLAVGVVVAVLGPADLVAAAQHRHAL